MVVGNARAAGPAPRPELRRFADWLRGEMQSRRLSANGLALKVGASSAGMSLYLRGLSRPRLETLRRMAEHLGVPLAEVEALLPEATIVPEEDVERARVILAAEGYEGVMHLRVETNDLVDRVPPITRGMVVWLSSEARVAPGRVLGVEVGGRVLLRTLAADGHTLTSAMPGTPTLDLSAVDRVLGVGVLAQVPL